MKQLERASRNVLIVAGGALALVVSVWLHEFCAGDGVRVCAPNDRTYEKAPFCPNAGLVDRRALARYGGRWPRPQHPGARSRAW